MTQLTRIYINRILRGSDNVVLEKSVSSALSAVTQVTKSKTLATAKPPCNIRDILLDVIECSGIALVSIARWLGDETRAAHVRVPVVVDDVVETGLGDCTAGVISMPVDRLFKCDY